MVQVREASYTDRCLVQQYVMTAYPPSSETLHTIIRYVQLPNVKESMLSKFKNIDVKLKKVSDELGATLTIDRPWAPKSLHQFEERRIDWEEDSLNKAIIIQPYFGSTMVDATKWSFINIAWIKRRGIAQKPGWKVKLIEDKEFSEIEKNIDYLLEKSIQNLNAAKFEEVEKLIRKR